MEVLVTLEPYARGINPYELILAIGCGEVKEILAKGKLILDLTNCDEEAIRRLRNVEYVAHISIVYKVVRGGLQELIDACRELLERLNKEMPGSFKVIARRIDKGFPMTSLELAKRVGQALSEYAPANLEDPDYYIYIEVREGHFLIAYSTRELYAKRRKAIPREWVEKVIAIVEGPREVYETMDLIQLSHAFGIEIRLMTSELNLERAYRALRLNPLPTVKLVKSHDEALSGIDVPIVLSMHARHNEERLIEIVKDAFKRNLRIGLILGNEYEDVSLELRRKAVVEVRLGPLTGHPMRTTIALSYALGLIFTTWILAGYA